MEMAIHEDQDIVIVGAGVAGLTTALGLHRLGLWSLVLESSDGLRITGSALNLWTNAWRALDAVGIGDILRQKTVQILGFKNIASQESSLQKTEGDMNFGKAEVRCVRRKELLETLERELPQGAVRYSSMVDCIEQFGNFKLIHLAGGLVIRTKVLIGCDGVNSAVARWLGFQSPVSIGRSEIRGVADFLDSHGFEPKFHMYSEGRVRCGFIPCDDKSIYWFCTFRRSVLKNDENEGNSSIMKQFVLKNIQNAPKGVLEVVEKTELDGISCSPLKSRLPWNVLLGNIAKDNVCVVGDALHPMPPDIGQGGCSALEGGVILARYIAEALSVKPIASVKERNEAEHKKIEKGLRNYSKERRWRSFSLVSGAIAVGLIQESDCKVMSFLRNKKFFSRFMVDARVRMADFDCGKLVRS